MALIFADSFDHYTAAQGVAKWDNGTPPVASVGRRGTQGLNWARGGLARNIGAQTDVIVGVAVFPTSSDYVSVGNKHNGQLFNNLVTASAYIVGLGFQGLSQCGLAFAMDGSLHLIKGASLDTNANDLGAALLASSSPGALPLTGWSFLEVEFTESGVLVHVNGVEVLDHTGNPRRFDTSLYTQLFIGSGGFSGISGTGWSGKIDDLYVLNKEGDTNTAFLGDVRVDYLKPNGAGAYSDSVIQGTTPAPTRWQSVDDQTPDDDVSRIALADPDDRDSYAHEDLPLEEATVFGVQHVIYAKKSESGLAGVVATQRLATTDDDAAITHYPAGGEYAYLLSPFDKAADDSAWTKEKFDDSEFGLKRVAAP
jgi:hypothetical protein